MAACWAILGMARAGARALEGKREVRRARSVGGKREGFKMWVAMSAWRNLLGSKIISYQL